MSFTGRIKLYLVAIALLPPLFMMGVVYFYAQRQSEIEYRHSAGDSLAKLARYDTQFRDDLSRTLATAATGNWMTRVSRLASRGRTREIDFSDLQGFNVDYAEILDSTGQILASAHRPALVGDTLRRDVNRTALVSSVEYDINGPHAALGGTVSGDDGIYLNAGRYLEMRFQPTADLIINGRTNITFTDSENNDTVTFARMERGILYDHNGTLRAVVSGGPGAGYFLTAEFRPPSGASVFGPFIPVVSMVALGSVLVAILLGVYIANRAQREIDNLVEAFTRVAAGDMNAAVMAYHDEEFVKLADSFSEMMRKLRESQQKLATSEKIAAWQAMARKIAHEIKNPLTPIGISADDLRRSYTEQLPGFETTLHQNTRMIRTEVDRLGRLLSEFVAFARMKPPEMRDTDIRPLLTDLVALYSGTAYADRVRIVNHAKRHRFHLGPDEFKQLLVNLIKNGLETHNDTTVELLIEENTSTLRLTVRDNGPGFAPEVLERQFEPYLSTKPHGSGLGLVVCQRIAHDHGGTITLKNRDEGGAEVVVELPQE